jgi:hypothetical protein
MTGQQGASPAFGRLCRMSSAGALCDDALGLADKCPAGLMMRGMAAPQLPLLLLLLTSAAATNNRDAMQCWGTGGSREVTRQGSRICFYGHCIGLCEDCSPLCGKHGDTHMLARYAALTGTPQAPRLTYPCVHNPAQAAVTGGTRTRQSHRSDPTPRA